MKKLAITFAIAITVVYFVASHFAAANAKQAVSSMQNHNTQIALAAK